MGGVQRNWETILDLHAGFNRLEDGFQFQEVVVPAETFGTRDVFYMDRQRMVLSARGEHHLELSDGLSGKAILYSEFHHIGEGRRIDEQQLQEVLPGDAGILLGTEIGSTGRARVIFKFLCSFKQGLAAYDELGAIRLEYGEKGIRSP